ncbi:hypothetical protein V497_00191, partial [Pseudogymnoascus sp. VKM F-4516 (FW-969)]
FKEQESAGHHPMIPVVDHTSIFCCKVPPGVKYVIKMNCPRTSNQERAKWRTECREKLANHIHSQLGLAILPIDVKLITKPEDLKHSTGAYIDLCSGVGVHFKAVLGKGAAGYDPEMRLVTSIAPFDAPEKSREHPSSDAITFQSSANEWREKFNAEVAIREALGIEMIEIRGENATLLTEIQSLREKKRHAPKNLKRHGRFC